MSFLRDPAAMVLYETKQYRHEFGLSFSTDNCKRAKNKFLERNCLIESPSVCPLCFYRIFSLNMTRVSTAIWNLKCKRKLSLRTTRNWIKGMYGRLPLHCYLKLDCKWAHAFLASLTFHDERTTQLHIYYSHRVLTSCWSNWSSDPLKFDIWSEEKV